MATTTTSQTVTEPPSLTSVLRNEPITASNITTLFPEVTTRLIGADLPPNHTPSQTNGTSSNDLSGYDAEQIRLMDEMCIVLSPSDEILGSATKKYTHLMTNINRGLLHRAFSCFLFDRSTKKLLLQQRASEKITFPDMWTNTCCSHPLAHPAETGNSGDLVSSVEGAKRAAVRKLGHELGIDASAVPISEFRFLTRIHYLAPSGRDGKWGEHEIDYILFIEVDQSPLKMDVNPNEVKDVRWVSEDELKQMFRDSEIGTGLDRGALYTPWFRLICEGLLFGWWELLRNGQLSKAENETEIRRM